MVYFENIVTISLCSVLNQYGLALHQVSESHDIPYSFWGAPEAGRKNNQLFVRFDTPIHSILHEACHFVCMPKNRRYLGHVDTTGGVMEENATCYLQILLSNHLAGFSRTQHMADMDDWGYSFRLGTAAAWFYEDAEDAKNWLAGHKIIDQHGHISWKHRR